MNEAAALAGFFAAHAVWSVCDGETLIPIYAYTGPDDRREMERLLEDRLEQSVEIGKRKLDENPEAATSSVLIYDGRITLSGGKTDALILEFRSHLGEGASVVMVIPYTPKTDQSAFAVHRPKVVDLSDHLEPALQEILEAFFEGVGKHEQGAKVWDKHLDESL